MCRKRSRTNEKNIVKSTQAQSNHLKLKYIYSRSTTSISFFLHFNLVKTEDKQQRGSRIKSYTYLDVTDDDDNSSAFAFTMGVAFSLATADTVAVVVCLSTL